MLIESSAALNDLRSGAVRMSWGSRFHSGKVLGYNENWSQSLWARICLYVHVYWLLDDLVVVPVHELRYSFILLGVKPCVSL